MIKQHNYNPEDWLFMSQRQRMSPFPNYMSMESVCNEMEEYAGAKLSAVILFFQDRMLNAFPDKESFDSAGRLVADKIFENPKLVAELVKKQEMFGKDLIEFAKKANKKAGKQTSNQDLFQMFLQYENKYKPVYATYGWVWMAEDFFMGDLLKIVEEKIKDDIGEAAEVLNILTRQPSAMVATMERKALLELGLKISENPEWKDLVAEKNIDLINKQSELNKLMQKHVDDYFWLTRDYEDPVLTFADIVGRLQEHLQGDIKKEHEELVVGLKENEKNRQKYLVDLDFSPQEKELFQAMRDAAHLKELRKRHVSESLYYFDRVLREIGRKLYLSIKQIRFMRTVDVKRALLEGEDLTDKINQRIKLSFWHSDGKQTQVLTGRKADDLFTKFCQVDKNTKEFRGMPVSPGKARGPVKIVIDPDECGKVEKGDIIVSVQVVPSFSTAIIKSAGLVCDGGHGITSHPATLAREAGIPCVIQTRFAREVLQDGDIVEVDGYKGVVKKL